MSISRAAVFGAGVKLPALLRVSGEDLGPEMDRRCWLTFVHPPFPAASLWSSSSPVFPLIFYFSACFNVRTHQK